ncbi:MAG: hypothetical protein IT249_06455 [Chitinophagaceae bacterium]|nr:hypothetical protein [Chitinophagaceae bacterium]
MFSSLFLKRMLPVALAFGTAWAVRGQIGHEYGATWAAAIGIACVIALSGKQDWIARMPVIVALGAIAWGSGGMISYGQVVGYGHAPDFFNTSYGLLSLMLIGGLYGFMGGGITGLAMESIPGKKVNWANVIVEMFVGGFLFWGFFIYQLEWFMTPPRSELWAACAGASLALGWHMHRNGYPHALRVAIYSSIGAGFGFGLGNFLQRMGHVSGIKFNWWNVMEYSIGFFSGLGLAYGVFSRKDWPKTINTNKASNIAGWVFLVVILPVINLIEAAGAEKLFDEGKNLSVADPGAFSLQWRLALWVLSAMFVVIIFYIVKPSKANIITQKKSRSFVLLYLLWYIILSNIISATWLTPTFNSQHLYWVNLLVIGFMLHKNEKNNTYTSYEASHRYIYNAIKLASLCILIILILSFIAVSIDYVHPQGKLRFE